MIDHSAVRSDTRRSRARWTAWMSDWAIGPSSSPQRTASSAVSPLRQSPPQPAHRSSAPSRTGAHPATSGARCAPGRRTPGPDDAPCGTLPSPPCSVQDRRRSFPPNSVASDAAKQPDPTHLNPQGCRSSCLDQSQKPRISIGPLLSLQPATILIDRGERAGHPIITTGPLDSTTL
jgi:hypothetical protein